MDDVDVVEVAHGGGKLVAISEDLFVRHFSAVENF